MKNPALLSSFAITILMIARKKYLFLGTCLLLSSLGALAQLDSLTLAQFRPEFRRSINHEAIDREQNALLGSDGRADRYFSTGNNDEINYLLTRSATYDVDVLQYEIENDSLLDHRLKVTYLSGLSNVLKAVRTGWKDRSVNPLHLTEIVNAYREAMTTDRAKKSLEPLISSLPYDAGYAVMRADIFSRNPGYRGARNALLLKYCSLHPDQTLRTLKDNPDLPYSDSLIRVVARKYPSQLYDYAQANNRLGVLIRSINDDVFVSSIARMARSKSGQQYFPFLDNIVNGKITIDEIDKVESDSIGYFRLLVRTQMDYVNRLHDKDTAYAFRELRRKLEKKARDVFVTTINGLHNEPDAIRFRSIQSLTAEELYYLAVLSDGLIYTSSYTNGVYPLMMKKINNRGDSLLMSLHFDHYRKFISQAAAYNTLGNFLSSFPNHEDADDLMRSFVSKLERSDGLEDGVDVADSYASIMETLKPRAAEMLKNVQVNYERNARENNPRGMAIYNILYKLFLSADSSNNIDLTKELGIPPVYNVPFSSLADEKGEVTTQVFFYGDKDGQGIFIGFLNMFPAANWKIDRSNPQWVTIKSTNGKPVTIYANKPLPEETGEDDKAQQALGEYLRKNNINPTVTIHRGHSYFANSTIAYMAPSSKIVFMGSCGGYHLIDSILHKSTDAHIIASKQIGKTAINKPFFSLLTEKLRNGNSIDWIPFWKEFEARANTDGFEDYIPPYKNLGAIFIKAYRKAMGEQIN